VGLPENLNSLIIDEGGRKLIT